MFTRNFFCGTVPIRSSTRNSSLRNGLRSASAPTTFLIFVNLEGDYDIYEVDLPERWVGMSVGEIDIRKKYGINMHCRPAKRHFWISPFKPETVFEDGKYDPGSRTVSESCRNALRFNILFAPMRACETCRPAASFVYMAA